MGQNRKFIVKSGWWSLSIPIGWEISEDEDCVTVSKGHSSGALQISFAKKDSTDVSDDDLKDFASDRVNKVDLKKVEGDGFTGFTTNYIHDGIIWQEWWIRSGNLMAYITYNTKLANNEAETVEVGKIVGSLEPVDDKSLD